MLYHLSDFLKHFWFPFNVLHYISFRSFLAFLTAFFVVILLIPPFGSYMKKLYTRSGGVVREYLEHHNWKRYTPSMGGVVIVLTLSVLAFLFLRLDKPYPYLSALVLLSFGLIGFADDILKLLRKRKNFPKFLEPFAKNGGLSAKQKLFLQFTAALPLGFLIIHLLPIDTKLYLPFFKELTFDLGIFYPLFAAFLIVGFSNAVNITDGLDGLAVGGALTTAAVMSLVAYLSGNYIYANYLGIPYVPYAGELAILTMAFLGAGLAFLWYNTYPAKVFMGDVGSLSVGAFLAFVALATKSEFILLVAGGLFVLEIISVILQIVSCKLTKKVEVEYLPNGERRVKKHCKRIFEMAPLHHHFEKKGWKEPQIVVRLWIISALLGVLSLTLLKLR